MQLNGKKIVLGICGSIAAYKAILLLRLLVKQGAEVQVIITPAAKEFVTPLTLATLSNRPVIVDFFDNATGQWSNHIELGTWADYMLIAPATATTIAKLSNGLADNLLVAVYLSARCPVAIAPAMDCDMFAHPSTQQNLNILASYGNIILQPEEGQLASGLVGKGRMQEPEALLSHVVTALTEQSTLGHCTALVTAGPTQEPIDNYRFVTTPSTGSMGYAIASQLANKGAKVILVAGPTYAKPPIHRNITTIPVTTTTEMLQQCLLNFDNCNALFWCAATAGIAPVAGRQAEKNQPDPQAIWFENLPDIPALLASKKSANQLLVAFALQNTFNHNQLLDKYINKGFSLVVSNTLFDSGTQSVIYLVAQNQAVEQLTLSSKESIVKSVLARVTPLLVKLKN